ncbi:kinase domain containing protein, partial [Diplocarpon rosae]
MDVTKAEEDETSSEAANEPSTPPAENQYSHGPFKEMMDGTPTQDIITHPFSLSPNPLAMMQTSGTLPTKRASTFASQTPQSTIQRMTLLPTEKPSIKRGLSGLFKRAQSHSVSNLNAHIKTKPGARLERPVLANGYVSEILPTNTAKLGFSTSSSAYTSGSNSPPTPGSPATHGQGQAEVLIEGSSLQDDCARSRKSSRSSGGFGLRDRITKHIAFHPHEKATPKLTQRHRATSMDLESSTQGGSPKDKSQVQLPSRQVWGLAADAGTGLKSRRLSMSLPDTFMGDLFSLVSQKYLSRDDRLVDRLCLFKQLLQGLNYLHANGIAHRDVKLENLLLTRDSKLKITDFGVSEVFCGVHPGLRSAGGQCGRDMGEIRLCAPGMCGSPPYVAPEVIAKQEEYDPRPLDAWGAAIVMLCMTANGVLWDEAKPGSSP